jgi:hypothetical protein
VSKSDVVYKVSIAARYIARHDAHVTVQLMCYGQKDLGTRVVFVGICNGGYLLRSTVMIWSE